MGAMGSKDINLRILVDKKREQVVFAEADKDFVDILCSFLTLPVGTAVRIVYNQSKSSVLGCMNTLYKGLENLDVGFFRSDKHKAILLRPNNSSEHLCRKLKFNIDDTEPIEYHYHSQCIYYLKEENAKEDDHNGGVFVNGKTKFMISDDLKVMPMSTSTSLELLTKLGVKDVDTLEERIVKVGKEEVFSLLRLSLCSKTPLTDLFLLKHVHSSKSLVTDSANQILSGCIINSPFHGKKLAMMIMVRKSDSKVLYAEAQEDFINHLFSLLSIPLGAIVKLLDRTLSLNCLTNLYTSVEQLGVDRYIKNNYSKTKLLSPMLSSQFSYKIQLLGIHENFRLKGICQFFEPRSLRVVTEVPQNIYLNEIGTSGFIDGPGDFVVTDDLNVMPLSPVSNIFLLNKFNVSISDIEERVVHIGRGEGLRLLEASITTTSALSSAFSLNLKNLKIED